MKRILVLGSSGQLGTCLKDTLPPSKNRNGFITKFATRTDADIDNVDSLESAVADFAPNYIVNCAAYTNVDDAETHKEEAFKTNHKSVKALASLCSSSNINLIHISTDFVFDGKSSTPYATSDPCNPLSTYGESKLQGELALVQTHPAGSLVIRTSWLYSEFSPNFVTTMLRLFEKGEPFKVVNDQTGAPTYAMGLAELIWCALEEPIFSPGILHWCDGGKTTWFDFANQISEFGLSMGLLSKSAPVSPVSSAEYGAKAARPACSVLDCESTLSRFKKMHQRSWESQLKTMLIMFKSHNQTDRGKS